MTEPIFRGDAPPPPRWPEGYGPAGASVRTRNEAMLKAPIEPVWEALVRAPAWSERYRHGSDVRLPDGETRLGPGMQFRWRALGLWVESTVVDFEPPARLSWFACRLGVRGFHDWALVPEGEDTFVRTEETQHGWFAWLLRPFIVPRVTAAHTEWLAALEQAATASGRS